MSIQAENYLNLWNANVPCLTELWLEEAPRCIKYQVPSQNHGIGGTLCQTSDYLMKMNKGLLPAQFINANFGYMATWQFP